MNTIKGSATGAVTATGELASAGVMGEIIKGAGRFEGIKGTQTG